MSATIYLVSTGCYSDYTIRGVYSTEDKAKRAAELYDGEVEPMALDDMPDAPPGMVAWRVVMARDGSTNGVSREVEPYKDRDWGTGRVCFEMWATDGTHAVKIANERRIVMLAENRWPADPPPEPVHIDQRHCEPTAQLIEEADHAYAALVNLFGDEVATARMRRFQKAHGLDPGAPIRNVAEYIAFLQDCGGEVLLAKAKER